MASPELERQIAAEAEELKNMPKVPIKEFLTGHCQRCHICGQLFNANDLTPFETQSTPHGPVVRIACPNCHPQRGTNV